jgi:hypothetical protein
VDGATLCLLNLDSFCVLVSRLPPWLVPAHMACWFLVSRHGRRARTQATGSPAKNNHAGTLAVDAVAFGRAILRRTLLIMPTCDGKPRHRSTSESEWCVESYYHPAVPRCQSRDMSQRRWFFYGWGVPSGGSTLSRVAHPTRLRAMNSGQWPRPPGHPLTSP